jgi:predicted Zn-dependent peptidase
MAERFVVPAPGPTLPVRFPAMARDVLDNGLAIRTISQATVPVAMASLLIPRGTSDDPVDRHGLASLTGDLIDEGAGSRDAIELAEAFAQIGAEPEIEVGPDSTSISVAALSRHLDVVLDLMADIVIRPRLEPPDFARVRELRLSRLRQLSQSATTIADRVYLSTVFAAHPYGHGAMGTTTALEAIALNDARAFWSTMYGPGAATLIVGGAVDRDQVVRAAGRAFGGWSAAATSPEKSAPDPRADPRIVLVDRPGAPQSELRVGHLGPARRTPGYHQLVTLNAILGGQFISRINRRLREEKGLTYGARTTFDFRRIAGTFSCETSVQADRTAEAVADILMELEEVGRDDSVDTDELVRAKASLTRGYVRHFETSSQLVRAAAQLVTYALDDLTFDRFVSQVNVVTASDVHAAARQHIRPSDATVVVVGDVSAFGGSLEGLGRSVSTAIPEF